ncbi:hypothetical protein AAG906_033145 [Vitis piasezkii]
MEVVQVLCMKGGNGDISYTKNSLVQLKKIISLTKPMIGEAITNLFYLGCSSGPNTFFAVLEVVTTVDKVRKKMDRQLPEIQKTTGAGAESCFKTGVPGSFYSRLFPSKSLHFVHSSSISIVHEVPQGLESNKGNIYTASSSPPSVLKAYYEQFQSHFSMFLRCRSEELLGGSMVLTFLGRSDDPSSKECCYIWELLAVAINDMVAEGLIDEEKMDSFNIPQYASSPVEVKCEVEKEGSFTINRLEVSKVNWNAYHGEFCASDAHKDCGYNVANLITAVMEPLLVSHFGDGIIEEVFSRYKKIVVVRMSREKIAFVNVTVSMTKRG